jgi:hypothetical protein
MILQAHQQKTTILWLQPTFLRDMTPAFGQLSVSRTEYAKAPSPKQLSTAPFSEPGKGSACVQQNKKPLPLAAHTHTCCIPDAVRVVTRYWSIVHPLPPSPLTITANVPIMADLGDTPIAILQSVQQMEKRKTSATTDGWVREGSSAGSYLHLLKWPVHPPPVSTPESMA